MYNSYNLRNDAVFETKIYPDVYWVPFNSLGKTRYSNADMHLITKDNIVLKVANIYELAQFVQVNNYKNIIDISFEDIEGEQWEIHKSGIDVLNNQAGCCSSYSGLAVYVLEKKFQHVYNFCIVSDTGWGHAMNCIEYNGFYYFFDISAQVNNYCNYVPVETGIKQDFVKAKFITGGCYRTCSIEAFIDFFLRYHMLKMTDFIFYMLSAITLPPVLIEKKDICYVSFCESDVHKIYEYSKKNRIKYINRGME